MFDQICRLCLRQTPILYPLFVENRAQMFEFLTLIRVYENDPCVQICLSCLCNLKLAFKIQQDMREADKKLQRMWMDHQNSLLISPELYMESQKSNNNLTTTNKPSVKELLACTTDPTAHCLICTQFIGLGSKSYEHMEKHFQDSKMCTLCDNKSFVNFSDYKQHIVNNHQTGLTFKKCDSCDCTFFYESLYNVHVDNAHPLVKPFANFLDSDHSNDGSFTNYDSRQADTKKNDPHEIALKSLESIRVSTAIKKRINRAKKERRFMCPVCNRVFNTYKKYYTHKDTHRRKTCPICLKECTIGNYKKHVDNHSVQQQICELCGNTFKNKEGLRTHMFYSHSENKYKCDRCGQAFKKKCRRDLHIRRDHEENPTFICDTCGKKFYTNRQMMIHVNRMHLKLRPFVCNFCEKAFSSRNAMVTHRRQHTLEAPYKCEICGESFRQKVSLKTHKQSKHNIVEEITVACPKCGRGFANDWALASHKRAKCE